MSSSAVLVRAIGFWALAASIVNVTIGGSIFALPGSLAVSLGAAAPLAFILGALLFVPITLCFAAVGSRVIATGGPYSYVTAAFGAFPGFAIAVFLWISSVAGSGSLAAVLADQTAHLFPALAPSLPRASFMLAIYALLVALNARGIRMGATLVVGFAAAKVIPLMLLAVAASGSMQWNNLHIVALPDWRSLGSSLVIVVFAYSGVETALAPSGEMRNPSKIVPLATVAGVGMVIALYVGLQWIAQGVLGNALAGNNAPLVALADHVLPGTGKAIVLIAFVSLVGCLQGDLLGSSRLLFALARDRFLPAPLAALSTRSRVPVPALLAHATVAWSVAAAGSFTSLALVSGGAFCFVYIACCAAAWRLKCLPGGPVIPALGIAALCGILITLQPTEWRAIAGAFVAVVALYAATRFA